jgi:hypothetical protein
LVGALLGVLGSMLSASVRITGASLAALTLAVLATWHIYGTEAPMLERDCETAQRWMELGPVRWAVLNGAALGIGFVSRIGFVSWYAVPVACLAVAEPWVGALVFGTYGAGRGLAVWGWFLAIRHGVEPMRIADDLWSWKPVAERMSGLALLTLATTAVVSVGL